LEPATLEAFTPASATRSPFGPNRISHVRIEPEIELNGPATSTASSATRCVRAAGAPARRSSRRGPARSTCADEAALWGDLRKKWRQYVNKARKGEVRVVDATVERLPEFYSIYQETAKRAGFVIRTYESYLGVWQAFARLGMARLLMAEGSGRAGLATLFLLRVGDRVIEPYGGMTAAGADLPGQLPPQVGGDPDLARAGRRSYDMWGISHEGIEHFKAGFGGREIATSAPGTWCSIRPAASPSTAPRSGRTGSAPGATASGRSEAGRTPRPAGGVRRLDGREEPGE
jgi:hypothetical protein